MKGNITQEQPMEEMQRATDGKSVEFLCSLEVYHSPLSSVCSPTRKPSETCPLAFLVKHYYYTGSVRSDSVIP